MQFKKKHIELQFPVYLPTLNRYYLKTIKEFYAKPTVLKFGEWFCDLEAR